MMMMMEITATGLEIQTWLKSTDIDDLSRDSLYAFLQSISLCGANVPSGVLL